MRKIDFHFTEDGRPVFRYEDDERFTREQKYNLYMALIVAVAACKILSLFFGLFTR